jgi:hypothetical protein
LAKVAQCRAHDRFQASEVRCGGGDLRGDDDLVGGHRGLGVVALHRWLSLLDHHPGVRVGAVDLPFGHQRRVIRVRWRAEPPAVAHLTGRAMQLIATVRGVSERELLVKAAFDLIDPLFAPARK